MIIMFWRYLLVIIFGCLTKCETAKYPTILKDHCGYGVQGHTLTLVCWTYQNVQQMEWIFPRNETNKRSTIFLDSSDGIRNTLVISNFDSKTDVGTYICTVKLNSVVLTTNIEVRDMDKNKCNINVFPNGKSDEVTFTSNSSRTLSLKYCGYPQLKAEWKHPNGTLLKNSTEITVVHKDPDPANEFPISILSFHNVKLKHAGVYRLDVFTEMCNISRSVTLNVYENPTITLHHQFVNAHNSSNINFSILGNPMSDVTCSYRECPIVEGFKWPLKENCTKAKTPYVRVSNHTNGFIQNATIEFKSVSPSVLECFANNSKGSANKSAYIYVIEKDRNPTIEIPNEVVDGVGTQIECFVPRYNFSNKVIFRRSDETSISVNETVHTTEKFVYKATITFPKITKSDQGNYTCSAAPFDKSEGLKSGVIAQLNVSDLIQPHFNGTHEIEELVVENSNPLILPCQPIGMPTPTVEWFKGSVNKLFSDNVTIINKTHLNIDRPSDKDEGIYECRATGFNNKSASKLYNVRIGARILSKQSAWIMVILLVVLSMVCLVLIIFYRREHAKHLQLKRSGISYFIEGNKDAIDPDKSITEQADLLGYDNKFDFTMNKLKLGKELGSGEFGTVLMAEAKGLVAGEARTTVAVKMVKPPRTDEKILSLIKELKIMILIGNHANIVNILGVVRENINQRELLVITEFCELGNLQHFVANNRKYFVNQIDRSKTINPAIGRNKNYQNISPQALTRQFSDSNEYGFAAPSSPCPLLENETTNYIQHDEINWNSETDSHEHIDSFTTIDLISWSFQVTQGMQYVSSRGVMHGDLAARNVLLCRNRLVKICDFGLSRSIQKDENYTKSSEALLPWKWLAPESLTQLIFNTKTDVWSFGVFMWELFSLSSVPYVGISYKELPTLLMNDYRMSQPTYATPDIYTIMKICWQFTPSHRPTFTELGLLLSQQMSSAVKPEYSETNRVATNDNYFIPAFANARDDGFSNILLEYAPMTLSVRPNTLAKFGRKYNIPSCNLNGEISNNGYGMVDDRTDENQL